MKIVKLVVPAVVLGLLVSVAFAGQTALAQAPRWGNDRQSWDQPPSYYNPMQRRAFLDGIDGARKDMENHRRPDPNNRDEYRSPSVPYSQYSGYRSAFKMGYERAMQNQGQAPEPQRPGNSMPMPMPEPQRPGNSMPPQPPQNGWGNTPGNSEYRQRGYNDGVVGAQRDMENHRNSNPNNRDEYRNPNVPTQYYAEYREGFRRGYEATIVRSGGGEDERQGGASYGGSSSTFQSQGYQDGLKGAQRDKENGRRPDPSNRDEFRSPNVPSRYVDVYREGFRRGYRQGVSVYYGKGVTY